MVIYPVLSAYTDQGLPLVGLDANDSHLGLLVREDSMHHFGSTWNSRFVIPLCIPSYCFPYWFT
jgi:hypothetical protein